MTTPREFPVWVPVGDHHAAAVVTLPEGDPRGVVVFTTGGGGAPRSQRFRLWTRAARGLADRGIASVRMEYKGVGDSTGVALFGLGWNELPIDQVLDVARFATAVTGSEELGLCGNCAGARASIRAADALPGCRSLALFWLKPLASPGRGNRARFRSAFKLFERMPAPARRGLSKLYWAREARRGRGRGVAETLNRAAQGRDLLLIETKSALAGELPAVIDRLRASNNGRRVEFRQFESTSMQAFQSLEEQETTVETVIEWFDRSFAHPNGAEPGVSEPLRPARASEPR
jgi:hypothetical protein